jgi:exosortase E/protease (VPEID-CTERM system)
MGRDDTPGRTWPFAVHAAALVSFVVLTSKVFEGPADAAPRWAIPWLFTGLVTPLSLAPFVASVGAWWRFVRGASLLLGASFAAGIVAWCAGRLSTLLAGPLQDFTTHAVFRFVAAFRSDAFLAPGFVVGTQRFEVEIAPACSGYEGMGLIAVFLGIFLWSHRASLRFPVSMALLPMAVTAAALANVVRLGLLVLVGETAPKVAQGGFHSYAGAVTFSAIALLTAYAALRLPIFARADIGEATRIKASEPESTHSDTFLAPFIVFLAAQLLTGLANDGGVDTLYPVRVVAVCLTLWIVRKPLYTEPRDVGWIGPVVGALVAVVWLALTPADPERSAALAKRASETPSTLVGGWLAFRAFGSIFVAPVVEELAFRGYLARRLMARDFEAVDLREVGPGAILISSALFGAFHPQVIAGAFAGGAYALIAKHRGRLFDAVVSHATTNALLVAYAALTGRWSAWL